MRLLNHGPLQTVTLKDQAYRLIKDAILYRRLQINTVYSQETLCSELHISRTPVREALIELQNEGYIRFVRGRGFQVLELTRQEALDIAEMRREIEMFGAELAAERITDKQLQELEKIQQEMMDEEKHRDSREMYRLDYAFHQLIFQATGNSWLMQMNVKLRENFLRIETQGAFKTSQVAKQVFHEHGRILAALQKRSPALARSAMKRHIHQSYKRNLENVLATGERTENRTE